MRCCAASGSRPRPLLGTAPASPPPWWPRARCRRSPQALAHCIRELNADYRRVLEEGHIATGALLAVGALPAAQVHTVLAREGPELSLAMDNCGNQMVLYGSRAAVEKMQAELTSMGAICMLLPFDRGYHTPAFAAVSEAFHAYYKRVKMGAPQRTLYSCCSAAPFPTGVAAARKLAAAQWSSTVRFRETVLRMHADGVRCFVEVGPSGNLSAFVDDILADHDHLAIATNLRRRHGLEQLLAALAQLYVNGHWSSAARLFDGRAVAALDLKQVAPRRPHGVLLDNTMPAVRLDDADRQRLRELLAPVAPPAPAEPMVPAGVLAPPLADAPAHAMVQTPVPADGADASGMLPFIDEVVHHDADAVHARSLLALHRDRFLQDHVLRGAGLGNRS